MENSQNYQLYEWHKGDKCHPPRHRPRSRSHWQGNEMKRLKDLAALYRIYRQCHGPIKAARYAWVVSGG